MLKVGELAALLRMDLGTLSPMLKRLEAKGLVTRRRPAAPTNSAVHESIPFASFSI